MSQPLMPKATAYWLIENTILTFDQIAEFCGIHELEVQALADGEINTGIMGTDPVQSGELTKEEIERCEKSPTAQLKMNKTDLPKPKARAKGPKYTPVAKRAEKPNAILFLTKTYPELSDMQIARLIGSTKNTVESIRNRTHSNMTNLKPTDPIGFGLCSYDDLEKSLKRARNKIAREEAAKKKELESSVESLMNAEATPAAEAPIAEEAPAPAENALTPENVTADKLFGTSEEASA